jgi:cytochrome P450
MTPHGHRPFWLVAKHADITDVGRQAEFYLNAPRTQLAPVDVEERIKVATGGRGEMTRTMLHMDGAEHRAYRGLAQARFTVAQIKNMEPGIVLLAKESVDRLEALGGECDFVNDLAAWYPLRVIMMILGIPPEEEAVVLKLTRDFVGRADESIIGNEGSEEASVKSAQAIFEYFSVIYRDRIANPRDDLASTIAHATIDGKPMNELEVLSYYLLIATAGHETTTATIAGGMLALLENPGEMTKLQSDGALMSTAVDEMLRWVTPVKHFFRTAARDCVLRNQSIKKGDGLLLCFPSGNRDEEVFQNAFSFLVDRSPNRHLSFGHGAHVCLGQYLARMEIRALFQEVMGRIESVERAGEPAWVATTFAGGLKSLPIRYTTRATR